LHYSEKSFKSETLQLILPKHHIRGKNVSQTFPTEHQKSPDRVILEESDTQAPALLPDPSGPDLFIPISLPLTLSTNKLHRLSINIIYSIALFDDIEKARFHDDQHK
jgi:hypothetical protein